MKFTRIMYIERKAGSVIGDARIGRVSFSKTMRSMYYDGKEFLKVSNGFKHNCVEIESNEEYWISGCRKDGNDTLYGGNMPIAIDEDVREEYWSLIRQKPELKHQPVSN